MKDLCKRTLTGLILVILLFASLFGGAISFFIFFSLLNIVGLWEFYQLVKKPELQPQRFAGIVAGFLTVSALYFVASGTVEMNLLFLVIPVIFMIFLIELFRKTLTPIVNVGFTLFGILYISLPVGMLSFLAFVPGNEGFVYSPWLIGAYFLLIMVNDSAGYLVGVPFGKNRLFERISPKKSWEGAFGGLVFTLLTAWGISVFLPKPGLIPWLIIGIIVVIFGTLGDLVESMFKRSLNVKDSGSIFPGHGGILDRYDALFISAPFVVAYLKIFVWNS